MTPSPFQEAIFAHLLTQARIRSGPRQSLRVSALAGSGKSTTIGLAMKLLEPLGVSCAYALFSRDAADDFKARAKRLGLKSPASTAHSFGLRALSNHLPKRPTLVASKVWKLVNDIRFTKAEKDLDLPASVNKLTKFAKDYGIGLEGRDINDHSLWITICDHHDLFDSAERSLRSRCIELSIETLLRSNSDTSTVDYPDMIYLPLLLSVPFERFDFLFIDEAQDTNYTKQLMYSRMVKAWGCATIVGDSNQAILGFTGADNDAMHTLGLTFSAVDLPLHICYRCDRAIVAKAQELVPQIRPADDAKDGQVVELTYADWLERYTTNNHEKDAILCRFNAPLVRLFFALLSADIPSRIEGKDIEKVLLKTARTVLERCSELSYSAINEQLEAYRQSELADAGDKTYKHAAIHDKCDALLVIFDSAEARQLPPLRIDELIESMFFDESGETRQLITLSTVHKAKGREWPRVFILGYKDYMPSRFAKLPWEKEQEKNLTYVAVTRAQHSLVLINEIPERNS